MVFQGIVWGPMLWNLLFGDTAPAVHVVNFVKVIYADNLNAYRVYNRHVSDNTILAHIDVTQTSLHSRAKKRAW